MHTDAAARRELARALKALVDTSVWIDHLRRNNDQLRGRGSREFGDLDTRCIAEPRLPRAADRMNECRPHVPG